MINNDPVQKVDSIGGINIAIEWPSGSDRRRIATDDPISMRADYGYFPGTNEVSDNMELDVYLGPNKESRKVFVIKQLSRESQYDEEKVMLGYDTIQEAQASYEYHIEKIPVKFGGIREIDWPVLTEMIATNLKSPEVTTAESKRIVGQMTYGSNEIVDDKEIREGIRVEAEHKDLIIWLKAYLKEHGEFPPDETIYAQIAKVHLEESPEYYKELAKMEEEMENKNVLIRQTRMVYGTKDNQWHEVGPEDRDYATGIEIEEFKRIGPEAAKAKYLGTGIVKNADDSLNLVSTHEDRQNEGARLYGSKDNK